MRTFYAPQTAGHAPAFFMMRGALTANNERPERAEVIQKGLGALGLQTEAASPATNAQLSSVHSPRYVAFLETAWDRWQALPGASPEVVANAQPRDRAATYPAAVVGQAGWHMGDLACPVGEHTFLAASAAAGCAIQAADTVERAGAPVYALARPPGHHAGSETAAGHCFFNNAALACQRLVMNGARVATLDIDVHHGNGTQAIFYRRSDVLTVSIHADPSVYYPWFVGHAGEAGEGDGEGYNRNIPLPMGTADDAWLEAVDEGLATVARFGADILVVSLGFDVHGDDPLGGFSVTTEGIARAAERIGAAGLPIVVIQEGGYLAPALEANVAAFFGGLLEYA